MQNNPPKFTSLHILLFVCLIFIGTPKLYSQSIFNGIDYDEDFPTNTDTLPSGTQFVDVWGYPWINGSNCSGCFFAPISLGNGLYQCNRFKLAFADQAAGNTIGFNDPTTVTLAAGHPLGTSTSLGALRRWTACQVFDYISQTITIPTGQSPDIIFGISETDGTGALAYASPFFNVSNTPAFQGGLLNQHIVTGVDPTPNATDYDAKIVCDFGPNGAWPNNGTTTPLVLV